MVEAGPALADPGVAALTADPWVLPIGAASPLVQRYGTTLTSTPPRSAEVVRGRVVGGSGAVNGGYFCRGLPQDFDDWGLDGWAWSDVLDSFRSIEHDLDYGDAPAHGFAGPIPVQRVREMSSSSATFVDRACAAGYEWIADLNGAVADTATPAGVGPVPLNITYGVRVSPGMAFLEPALSRPNLTVVADTRVRRVRFESGRARGVEADSPQGPVQLDADRIVLCAGAIGSAHLLMLSGVGVEATLRASGVPVVQPAAVGVGFTDHPEWVMPTSWVTTPDRPVLETVLNTDFGVEIRPYTGGFIAMVDDSSAGEPDWPHIGVALMRPHSHGRIVLVSADPTASPLIEHRYDHDPRDVEALRRGSELARQLCPPTVEVGTAVWSTSQHICGSAPMGAASDDQAVLDERCRVRGLDGLWVIDGSALPRVTSRGPHASIVMLAYRAAEYVIAG